MRPICKYLILIAFVLSATGRTPSFGRQRDTLVTIADTLTDEFLDTVSISRKVTINDYAMIGFQYGVAGNMMTFNPSKKQDILFTPKNFGIVFTKYGKMFGYMPYFGYQIGVFYGQDGYKTKVNKETGVRPDVDGAYEATYDYLEVPFMAHMHLDVNHIKLMANVGPYAGYRFNVHREGDYLDPDYADAFYDYDRKFDYGIKGGVGFALVFSPVEFHVTGQVRYGFSSLYDADYHSDIFYRFAYPLDFIVSAGVHFQITKRSGKTKGQLRKEAYNIVYGNEDIDGESR